MWYESATTPYMTQSDGFVLNVRSDPIGDIMRDLTRNTWKAITASDLVEMTGSEGTSDLVVKFDVPMNRTDVVGVTVQTVSGYVTWSSPVSVGSVQTVRFALDGEIYRVRPDFPLMAWVEVFD